MRSYKFTGIVLGSYDWREKDRLVWLLTRWRGKQRFLLRGARDAKSRRAGLFLTANVVRGVAHVSGRGIAVIGEAELLQPVATAWRLNKLSMLLYLGEVLARLLPENVPEPMVFNAFLDILITRSPRQQVEKVVKFSIELPNWLGFGYSQEAWQEYQAGRLNQAQQKAEKFLVSLAERRLTSLQLLSR